MNDSPQQLPLSGIKILDLTTTVFGPLTTQILGDFGADVIKIEAPGGDTTRNVGPSYNEGMSALFLGCNRNKRSIVLDLKQEQGRQALWRLIDVADVFVHNIRPQKIAQLGFDPDSVLARNPSIVYGGLHGYLEDGPYGGRPAYDDVVQGESGLAAIFAERDGTPSLVPSVIVDKNAAWMASSGILAAIVQRQRTGQGLYMEAGMFEGMVSYNLVEHQYGSIFSPPKTNAGYPRMLSSHRRPHRTADGYICMLAYTDKQWQKFWHLAGQPQMADDSRFATMSERAVHIDQLYGIASKLMSQRKTSEWLGLFQEAEIPAGPVNSLDDLKKDPHLKEIGFFRSMTHPSEGEMEIPDTAFRFNRKPLPVRYLQPRLGEHSREVLREAGHTEQQIDTTL